MHGVHGKLALQLVVVVPKRGTEQRLLLNMVALIVQEMILKNKSVMTIIAQVLYHYYFCCKTQVELLF